MGLLKTATKGFAWATASTVVRSIVSLLQVSILAHYLEKSDFGIVAIAMLFLGFTQIFLDMGISAGILHKQDVSKDQYSSLFWLNIFSGLFLTLILYLISPLVANYYEEPELVNIIRLFSLTILFSSLGSQHRTVLQKNMRFGIISIVEILTSIVSLLVAIVLVINDFGVYSLVYSNLVLSGLTGGAFLIIGLCGERNISLHFKLSDTYDYLKIGVFSLGSNILDYFAREFDVLIISTTLGKEAVGVYSLCKKLVLAVFSAINPVLMKVLTPILATLQGEKERLKKIYYDIVQSMAFINMPIYCLLAVFSSGILIFLYGEQYADSFVVLSFIALHYGLSSTNNPVGSLQIAMGRTDSGFYWTIVRIIATVLTVFIGAEFGLNGIAIGLFLQSVIINPVFWRITIKSILGGDYPSYFNISIAPCLIIIVSFLPVYFLFHNTTNIFLAILYGSISIFLFSIALYILSPQSFLVVTFKERLLPHLINRIKK